ncbi:Putative ribonuclease H protein [Arachis hypogaea]|nr:Putative ribonuclease H protein [Arachis hypogaea]
MLERVRVGRGVWHLLDFTQLGVEFRLGRGLALSSTCHRCQNGSESILHCLRECPSAKEVWNLLGLYSDNSNLHDWLYRGARSENVFLFFSTIWWIWRSRNHDLFNIDDSWSASKVVTLIRSSVREFHTIFAMHQSLSPPSLCLHWVPPPVYSVKLNCDASWFAPSGYAGFGCIIRNPDGCWLKGCTGKVEVCSVLFAELMLGKDIPEWNLAKHIQEVMNWNWRVSILLIQRTANSVADCMAKAAASVADIHSNWSQPWSELQHLIDLDMTLAN